MGLGRAPGARDGWWFEKLDSCAPAGRGFDRAGGRGRSLRDRDPGDAGPGADDDHDSTAQRAAGIDLLPEADELDAQVVELVEHLQEVDHGAGQPVESPDQQHIETTAAGVAQHLIESRPARLGAADLVPVLAHDPEAPLAGHLAQVEKLCLEVLIDGGDPDINRGALHGEVRITYILDMSTRNETIYPAIPTPRSMKAMPACPAPATRPCIRN